MALPVWPASVPHSPQRGSYKIERPFNKSNESEFEAGNTRSRPIGQTQYRIISQTIRMDQTEFNTFDAFVRDDLKQGTLRFTMTVWMGHEAASKTVKFSGEEKFTVATRARSKMVSMRLEVEL
jgi:hypothetical protein